ncbi:MAG: ABC transporter ATP-binding protein [Candidatus Bipolaricaulia bacterium]
MIEVDDLKLAFASRRGGDEQLVIDDLSLRVADGESLAIIGPSGCGKSSLLYVLSGLIRPTQGDVRVHGGPIEGPRSDVALILQETGLLPWKTVWRNAVFGLDLGERGQLRRVKWALRELGLEGMEDRYPAQLSGGEKKRVGLARALAQNAGVLLMDEPLAALDALTKERTQNLMLGLWRAHGYTSLLVTHDIEEAVFLGQRIAVLGPRPTQIADVIDNPEMGTEAYRQSEAFFETVRAVRGALNP